MTGTVMDITAAKQHEHRLAAAKELAEQASDAKSAFLANISHEIRTPLNAVLGFLALLRDTPINSEQRDFVDSIHSAAGMLLGLLNDLLDMSKIEAGKLELEMGPVDIRLAIEDTFEIIAEQAARKGLELTYLIDPSFPGKAIGDAGRVRQILLNLVSNAVKFTERGEVIVHAKPVSSSVSQRVRLEVQDTGPGIAAELLDKLFSPFTQADASITRRFGGTGLGLSLCRRLAAAMNGTVGVETQLGSGSTFWVELPQAAPGIDTQAEIPLPAQCKGLPVLVIDSHAMSLRHMGQALTRLLLTPILCASAKDARELLNRDFIDEKSQPAAILIASKLSDTDPQALAAEIRSLPRYARVQLALVGSVLERLPAETTPSAFEHFILKPSRTRNLVKSIQAILGPKGERSGRAARRKQLTYRLVKRDGTAPRVLLAEDNPVNQKLASLMMEKLGCRVDIAQNGHEALQAATRFPYDIIFMDCQMPESDGLEATRRIRQLKGPAAEIPIIALTAHIFRSDRSRCLAAGMNDIIRKPVLLDALSDALQHWVGIADIGDTSQPDLQLQANFGDKKEHPSHQSAPPRQKPAPSSPFAQPTVESSAVLPQPLPCPKASSSVSAREACGEDEACLFLIDEKIGTPAPAEQAAPIEPVACLQAKPEDGPLDSGLCFTNDLLSVSERLRELASDLDEGVMRQAMLLFRKESGERLAELEHRAHDADLTPLSCSAHRLKGSALQIGAYEAAERAALIERAAQRNDSAPLPKLLKELSIFLHQIWAILD